MRSKFKGGPEKPAFFVGLMLPTVPGTFVTARRSDAMALSQVIERIITPTVEGMGYELVRLTVSGGQRKTLQVMAEPKDGRNMSLDDCSNLSRAISAVLDVEDPIEGAYSLEVSSPGIDRPLIKPEDFVRFAGFEARVELQHGLDGRKRFRGRLLGFENGTVRMKSEVGEVALPLADIARAKLVLTDDLIAAATAKHS